MAIGFVAAVTTSSTALVVGNTTVTSASFTPAVGELLVVKATSGEYSSLPSTISGGSLTWTKQVTAGVSNTTCPVVIWTATVGTSAAMTVAVVYANTGTGTDHGGFVIERFTGAQLAATPATATVNSDTTSPYQGTLATTGAYSVVSWMEADYAGVNGTVTYVGTPLETWRYQEATAGVLSFSAAFQQAGAPGSQTFGMSAPTGQTATLAAIELQQAPVPAGAYTINGTAALAGATYANTAGSGEQDATEFYVTAPCAATAIRFYRLDTTVTGSVQGRIWVVTTSTTGTALAGTDVTFTLSGTGWQTATFAAPVPLTAGQRYRVDIMWATNRFASTSSTYWSTGPGAFGVASGPLVVPNKANGTGGFTTWATPTASTWTYPSVGVDYNYSSDVTVTVSGLPPAQIITQAVNRAATY